MTTYATCKRNRHAMDDIPVPLNQQPAGPNEKEIRLRCTRCGTIRHIIVTRWDGVYITSWYEWPPDYKDGPDRLSLPELRKQYLDEMDMAAEGRRHAAAKGVETRRANALRDAG